MSDEPTFMQNMTASVERAYLEGDQWREEFCAFLLTPKIEINHLSDMGIGDRITFSEVYDTEPNPDRRWWQFWKPRTVQTPYLRTFVISDMITASQGTAPPRQ